MILPTSEIPMLIAIRRVTKLPKVKVRIDRGNHAFCLDPSSSWESSRLMKVIPKENAFDDVLEYLVQDGFITLCDRDQNLLLTAKAVNFGRNAGFTIFCGVILPVIVTLATNWILFRCGL